MKVSISWLKEFIDFKITPEELAERINLSVVEVEEIINFGKLFKNVFVGEIKEIKKHPKADKLSIAKVLVGKKTIQIIFGGLKLKPGDKLPIAVAPAVLPTGLEVEKRLLRGVESQGMIASNKEMGLDFEGDVIFFKDDMGAGTPVAKALGLDDTVLNLDVLSNRVDLFSHIGVAREISAILGKKIKEPDTKVKEDKNSKIEKLLEVEIKDKNLCSRYEARVIKDIKIKESPAWLKNRLIVLGIRPINNVVDITNYVMMELGQPLHAFDFNKLDGGAKKKIIVRKAKTGEEIVTLDNKERKLTKDVLVIADSKNPIAIAGIMGSKNTEVDSNTKDIVLESANFNWPSIRKASRVLGIRTEAVTRFEKNSDPNLTARALDRAAELMSAIASGTVSFGIIDQNYSKEKAKTIELRPQRVEKYLGKNIPTIKIKTILTSLGMGVFEKGDNIEVKVPTLRRDIKEEVDLIEEVARIYGYDKIPTTSPVEELVPSAKNSIVETEEQIKNYLTGLGVTETFNYTFLGEELLSKFNLLPKNNYKLENPLKPEHTYLRQSLILGIVEAAEANAKNFEEFSIFEIARVFLNKGSKYPDEEKRVSILGNFKKDSFLKTKGILEELLEKMDIKDISFKPYQNGEEYWHPQRTAMILAGDTNIGKIGELHPEVLGKFDFKNKITVLEIDFAELLKKQEVKIFKPFSRFPKIVLDLAITVDLKVLEQNIREEIIKIAKDLVKDVELFDVYRGKQIEAGKKSLAYHITYQSDKKTLTDEDADLLQKKVINTLYKKFNAKIRS